MLFSPILPSGADDSTRWTSLQGSATGDTGSTPDGMMAKCHAAHIGIEGCLRRARDSMYWPWMSADLKDYRCDVCLAHQDSPQRETLIQHEITSRPWAKVGADLCDLEWRTLLILCDYFSGFIEVERLRSTTSSTVIKTLKSLFTRYGVPDMIISDNGPQFTSEPLQLNIQHITSSPRYPESNGKVENAIKRLFTKCRHANQSEFQALLDWHNTPTEGIGSSPAQQFLERRCRTLLPLTEEMLKPVYDTSADYQALRGKRAKQAFYYNWQAHDLPPISVGETVSIRLPGKKQWTSGRCMGRHGPRSYIMRVGEAEYRCNRRHLRKGAISPPNEESETLQTPTPAAEEAPRGDDCLMRADDAGPHTELLQPIQESVEEVPPTPQQQETPASPPSVRRSSRQQKSSDWITIYVPSWTTESVCYILVHVISCNFVAYKRGDVYRELCYVIISSSVM